MTAATIGATALSAGGQIVGGIQSRSIAAANARALRAQATREAELGAVRESQVRREYRQKAGLQRAQIAASGVTLDSLTSLDLGADLATQGFLDAQSARLDSQGRQTQLRNSARLARAEGAADLMRGVTGAAAGVLTAAPKLWPGLAGDGP
jgi:hypothetical protein